MGNKSLIKKADKLFSDKIKEVGKCAKCGTNQYLQTAHVLSRRYKQVRWDFANAVCLCRGCHLYFTHHPIEWEDYIIKKIGSLTYKNLRFNALQYGKIDYKEIIERLSND